MWVLANDNNEDYITTLKKTDMLDVIQWIAEAWEKIPNILIARSWNILLGHKDRHKPVWKNEVETENDKLLLLL